MEPIYLYGDNAGKVEYVEHMGSDLSIVNSARVSFGKHKQELDGKDRKLIKYLIKHRHTSTLEHCLVTFRFKVPLFIRSQHHRHRTWSYNEISRRYTEENLQFYEPKPFVHNISLIDRLLMSMNSTQSWVTSKMADPIMQVQLLEVIIAILLVYIMT